MRLTDAECRQYARQLKPLDKSVIECHGYMVFEKIAPVHPNVYYRDLQTVFSATGLPLPPRDQDEFAVWLYREGRRRP